MDTKKLYAGFVMAEPSGSYMADEHCGPYHLYRVVTLGRGQRAFGCIMMFCLQTQKVGGTNLTHFSKMAVIHHFFSKTDYAVNDPLLCHF